MSETSQKTQECKTQHARARPTSNDFKHQADEALENAAKRMNISTGHVLLLLMNSGKVQVPKLWKGFYAPKSRSKSMNLQIIKESPHYEITENDKILLKPLTRKLRCCD